MYTTSSASVSRCTRIRRAAAAHHVQQLVVRTQKPPNVLAVAIGHWRAVFSREVEHEVVAAAVELTREQQLAAVVAEALLVEVVAMADHVGRRQLGDGGASVAVGVGGISCERSRGGRECVGWALRVSSIADFRGSRWRALPRRLRMV